MRVLYIISAARGWWGLVVVVIESYRTRRTAAVPVAMFYAGRQLLRMPKRAGREQVKYVEDADADGRE